MADSDDASDDSSDKLLKEVEEEYKTNLKTGPNINKHLEDVINKRFAGKLKEAKLKETLELYVRPRNCEKSESAPREPRLVTCDS